MEAYTTSLNCELSKISIPKEAVECRNPTCEVHETEIEIFRNNIVQVCLTASKVLPSMGGNKSDSSERLTEQSVPSGVRPGWSEHCTHKRELALVWHWA